MRAMVIRIPIPTAVAGVRYVDVSLRQIDCLLADQPARCALPSEPPRSPPNRLRHRRLCAAAYASTPTATPG